MGNVRWIWTRFICTRFAVAASGQLKSDPQRYRAAILDAVDMTFSGKRVSADVIEFEVGADPGLSRWALSAFPSVLIRQRQPAV